MADRWDTGWVVIEGKRGAHTWAHQPHPDRPADRTMCARPCDPAAERHDERPEGVPACVKCGWAADTGRKRDRRRALAAQRRAAATPRRPKPVDGDAVDRRDRAGLRGSSVHTVWDHLPGRWLGRP